jgi:hypothetical protein
VLATKITEVSFLVFLVRCSWRVGVTHGRRGGSMLAARHAFAPINIGIGETSAAFGGAVALAALAGNETCPGGPCAWPSLLFRSKDGHRLR